jgi:flavin reductase (DIM6/NTAB) family NADH-FMN oxidoreductase RutF
VSDSDLPADGADLTGGVTGAQLRSTLGHFATGVVVITAPGPTGPVGMAVNSFTSVSLDPPLVLFCAATTSTTWPHVQAAGAFCVNVLAADQEELARGFAGSGDRYRGVTHRRGRNGAAILDGVLAYVDCEICAEYPAGDHVLVLGKVLDFACVPESEPLVFFRSSYRRLRRADRPLLSTRHH